MKQIRLKSPVLWGGAAALILLVLKALGYEDVVFTSTQQAEQIFSAVCGVLALFGIVNNPTDPNAL